VSEAHPVTAEPRDLRSGRQGRTTDDEHRVEVTFETGRWRRAGWAAFGVVAGVLLIWRMAAVAKGVGVALILLGLYNAVRFVITLIRPAGTILVTAEEVRLSRALCSTGDLALAADRIAHAYFLRRAVPWAKTGPVLVIETAAAAGAPRETFLFPRDWFASDADQRRIARALNRRLGRLP
jgi:hypothetical protein